VKLFHFSTQFAHGEGGVLETGDDVFAALIMRHIAIQTTCDELDLEDRLCLTRGNWLLGVQASHVVDENLDQLVCLSDLLHRLLEHLSNDHASFGMLWQVSEPVKCHEFKVEGIGELVIVATLHPHLLELRVLAGTRLVVSTCSNFDIFGIILATT